MPTTRRFPPWLGLLIGILAVSTASTFIRLAQTEANSLAIAAWRLTLASLVLAPIALTRCHAELRALTRREWLLAGCAGLMLTGHFASWITSLALTSVAASVALVSTSPLFVGVIAHFILKERLTRPMLLGLLVAMLGSVIIGLSDAGLGTHQLSGDLLALVGALTAAGYFLIGRKLRARLSLLAYVFPVYATAAVGLLIAALFSGAPLTGYSPAVWLWLALMALGPQVIGHSALNWALGRLSVTYVTLAVLAEPIGSAALAWWILKESPTPATLTGGALVLVGIVLASLRPSAQKPDA